MMKYRVYRICLIVAAMLALTGGIFYYETAKDRQMSYEDGTLVMQEIPIMQGKECEAEWAVLQEKPFI